MSILLKIETGKYINRLDYPLKPSPSCPKCETRIYEKDNFCSNCGTGVTGLHSELTANYEEERAKYRAEDRRLQDLFKEDCLNELGITEHKAANRAFDMAMERCGGTGLASVFLELEELSTLLV